MNRTVGVVAALMVLLPGTAPLSAQEAKKPTRSALVIGVSDYTDRDQPKLKFCGDDARRLAEILKANDYRVTLSTSDAESHLKPTLKNLQDLIDRELNRVAGQKDATLIVYFSGHGFLGDDEVTYLCPTDGRKGDWRTLIDANALARRLGDSGAKVYLFADCCREKVARLKNPDASEKVDPTRVGLIFGCQKLQLSKQLEGDIRQGIFSKYLTDALEGHFDEPGSSIGWDRLTVSIPGRVKSLANEHRHFQEIDVVGKNLTWNDPLVVARAEIAREQSTIDAARETADRLQKKWLKQLSFNDNPRLEAGKTTLELRVIPPGVYTFGSPETEPGRETDERRNEDQRQVKIPYPFFMTATEITQEQLMEVLEARRNQSIPRTDDSLRQPVNNLTLKDVDDFCNKITQRLRDEGDTRWRGYRCRLPSEEEWEYACRSLTKTPFFFGDSVERPILAADLSKSYPRKMTLIAVPGKLKNVSGYTANYFGLYDMHGNIAELCTTTDEGYAIRGGYFNVPPERCRSASRETILKSEIKHARIGFRIVVVKEK